MTNQVQGIAPPVQVIPDALQDERSAVAVRGRLDLGKAHPHRPDDARIEAPAVFHATYAPGEGEAQISHLAIRARPLVDAHQALRPKAVGGFLHGLPRGSRHQGFPLLEMAGRLIETQAAFGDRKSTRLNSSHHSNSYAV